jgi:hypothetical protein
VLARKMSGLFVEEADDNDLFSSNRYRGFDMPDPLRRVVRPATSKYESVNNGFDDRATVVMGVTPAPLSERNADVYDGRR